MSKYTYTPVESIADFDLTRETQYYLFEEGVGHEEYYFGEDTVDEIADYIEERTVFTRQEKRWYLRIPEKGVLCSWSGQGYRLIVSYDEEDCLVYDEDDNHYDEYSMTPLSNNQIMQFLQEDE